MRNLTALVFTLMLLAMTSMCLVGTNTIAYEITSVEQAYELWDITPAETPLPSNTPLPTNTPFKEAKGIDWDGVALIKKHEGFHSCAYHDYGGYSVGYGSVGYQGECISEQEAHDRLMYTLKYINGHINNLVKVPLSQGEFNALSSLIYNVGIHRFKTSNLLLRLNQGDKDLAGEFRRWIYAGGEVLGGLVKRREAEIKMWREK